MDNTTEKEKIEYQYIMNYKAYRRKTIPLRMAITLVIAGGLCGICAVSVAVGIVAAVMAMSIGVIAVLVSLGYEETYTVYNTRIVIKRRNKEKRTVVPIDAVTAVAYKRAFYEKDLATGTVTISSRNEKGKIQKCKLRHVFDAMPAIRYLKDVADKNNGGQTDEDRK